MNTIYWNGKMDMGLEDLADYISNTAKTYCSQALLCAEQSLNSESCKYITNESMKRFLAIMQTLTTDIPDIFYHQHEDLFETTDESSFSLKMKSYIMLGSVVESTMQIFMSVYLHDYTNSNWNVWVDFEEKKVQTTILPVIESLIEADTIERNQGLSLEKAVKDKIKKHRKLTSIDKVMLDELILFFKQNSICDIEDISHLRSIQRSRNCIHSYMDRSIGSWADLTYSIRFLGYFMEMLMGRFPDLSYLENY
ncbi:hypothetical protein [Scatolibacter rhodanostii]|uniref:hypothetical protein n=1 Tax=Scatolibacter rhodanostii TaxID=2014781 RepID=UPI000C089038|nr:hypothetical protein [Scatolibacter rhodanostii]